MRRPTQSAQLYAWHADALAGKKPQITHEPQVGWFKRCLVKGGAWVPARIWLHQEIDATGELTAPETLRCEVNGRPANANDQWPWLADNPISEAEYRYLLSLKSWAAAHAPEHPAADASAPIDFLRSPLPF